MKSILTCWAVISICSAVSGQLVLSPGFEKAILPKPVVPHLDNEIQNLPPPAFFFSPYFENQFLQPARLPIAYCYADLAFFCKMEVKIEKALRMPVKFRLGDVEYVDYLEGKRAP